MEAFFLLLGLLLIGGYVLGIVGFFRANTAHTQLRSLRRQLAELLARPAAPVEAAAVQAPFAAMPGSAEAPRPEATPAAPISSEATPAAALSTEPTPAMAMPFEAPSETPSPGEATDATPEQSTAEPIPPPRAPSPPIDIEALLTARWGVWLGAAALLLAGVFLIRYAVEQELLGPGLRCVLAALLGVVLLAGAEWLTRHAGPTLPGPLRVDQAPGGLAAGGAAMLFAAAYGAGPFYDLVPPLLAFLGMAAASLIGLAAALRYGQLTAAVGVAGAFVTPALVTTENPSLPGLFIYLFIVSAAALGVVRYTAWTWLGWCTMAAGAIWVCIAASSGEPDAWVAAVFMVAAAALNLALLPPAALDHPIGRRLAWVPFAVIGVAGLVLETQVAGDAPRICLFLLSPLAVWRGATEPRLDRLPWLAALLGLLTLLLWALPSWAPTGETITVEGNIEAFLPGGWAPALIIPLIEAAACFAAFHAAAGLWMERRAPRPLHWAALTAAVPVLTLLVSYAQIARFQSDFRWAFAALALTAGLTFTAARAAAEAAPPRAGAHAAGAVAALALGCAMILHDQWLTLAVSLFLPALALIEERADLPPLRKVALVVAGLLLVRLVLNWYVLDYHFGNAPVLNGLLAAYAAPAVAFAAAAWLFRRRADDLLVATLEAGAVSIAAIFVALEIRHGFGQGALTDDFGFNEIALHLLTLSVQGVMYLYLARRTGRRMFVWAWHIAGMIAVGIAVLMLLFNPGLTGARAGVPGLLAAYLAPAALALLARRFVDDQTIDRGQTLNRGLAVYALIAGFVWITLQIRHGFHPHGMSVISDGGIDDAELWAYSGAWLAYGIALMVQGIRAEERALRLAALVVVGLVVCKVFLIDMADLTGLWRVLSFLGLGLVLIGLGVVHRRFVLPTKRPASGEVG